MSSREPLSESDRPRQPAKECTNEGRAHFKEDKNMIVWAAKRAQAAVEFILG